MTPTGPGSTVVLCEEREQSELNRELAIRAGGASAYADLSDLLDHHSPESIGVLAIHARQQPAGALLATLTRWAVEFPWMLKVAVLDDSPTLPMAKQLTRCGFWLVRSDDSVGPMASVSRALNELAARQQWVAAAPIQGGITEPRRRPS